MDRAWQSDAIATPPAHTSLTAGNYPTNGNPLTPTPATQPGAYWFHMMTEEMLNCLLAGGATPDKSVTTQFRDVLRKYGLLGGQATALLDLSGATGGQIKFPATQNPSADPNTFDDYEEGSWTPVLGGSGGTSGQTYAVNGQVGRYVKRGKWVKVTGYIALTNKGTITGTAQVQGIPFTSDASANAHSAASVGWFQNLANNFVFLSGLVPPASSVIELNGNTAAVATMSQLLVADIGNTTILIITAEYPAAA